VKENFDRTIAGKKIKGGLQLGGGCVRTKCPGVKEPITHAWGNERESRKNQGEGTEKTYTIKEKGIGTIASEYK